MATSVPRLGNRGTLNTNVTGTIKSGIYTSQTITTNRFASGVNEDLVFYTLNPGSKIGSSGQLEQLRVDNSGNVVFNGSVCPATQLLLRDVSLNLKCHDKTIDVFASTTGPGTEAGLRLTFEFPNWSPAEVVTCLDIMCVMSDLSSNPTYSCVGKIGKITIGGLYFDTSTNGLTVVNGTVSISSKPGVNPPEPYYLFLDFIPTSLTTKIKTAFVRIVHATTAQQISTIYIGPT
jgi:hypothetical protein